MDKANTNTKLRTPETWKRYKDRRASLNPDECFLCRLDHLKVIKQFKHWVIVQNQYPYDAVAEEHHLLAPVTHMHEADIEEEELEELENDVRDYCEERYDFIGENTPSNRTQPQHWHIHLLTWRRV